MKEHQVGGHLLRDLDAVVLQVRKHTKQHIVCDPVVACKHTTTKHIQHHSHLSRINLLTIFVAPSFAPGPATTIQTWVFFMGREMSSILPHPGLTLRLRCGGLCDRSRILTHNLLLKDARLPHSAPIVFLTNNFSTSIFTTNFIKFYKLFIYRPKVIKHLILVVFGLTTACYF